MLWFALGFFMSALVAAFFGFGAVPSHTWEGGKVLFVFLLAIALGAAVGSRFTRPSWATRADPPHIEDPDVILVGEIRDRETAQIALSAAETGHLVFSTLHTRDSKGAITRFADLFPQDVQRDIRSQLAMSLRTIVSQRLLPDIERGAKRHLALEVLWNTYPIASAIRHGKLESIDNYLLTCRDDGMVSFDESVRQLLRAGHVTRKIAEQNVRDMTLLDR